MNDVSITLSLGAWIFPAVVTLAWIMAWALTAYSERNDSGFLSGLGAVLVFFFGLITVLVAWLVYGLTRWLS